MSQNISLWGATYSDVPAIEVPKSGGGMASFTDVTDTTAVASDVAQGKYFYLATGEKAQGTYQGVVIPDGDNIGYGNYVPAIVGQAIVGLSLVGEQTQPIVGTALAGLTQIGE